MNKRYTYSFATTSYTNDYVYNKEHYEKLKKLLNVIQVSQRPDMDIHQNFVMNLIGQLEHDGPLTRGSMETCNELWNHYTKDKPIRVHV